MAMELAEDIMGSVGEDHNANNSRCQRRLEGTEDSLILRNPLAMIGIDDRNRILTLSSLVDLILKLKSTCGCAGYVPSS
jgi:hypothetical protein